MTIYIYLPQPDIGQIIFDELSAASQDNLCFLFLSPGELSKTVFNQKTLPDLLILDYVSINHDLFNLYNYAKNHDLNFPVIFYNDPCLTKSTRAKHWMSQITLLKNYKKDTDLTLYEPVFQVLQDLIESEELSPYINLMQKPKPLPNYLKRKTFTLNNIIKKNNDGIEDFKNRVNLPKNLYFLLKIFQKYKETPLSIEKIQDVYESEDKKISPQSLKVLISNLRGEIKKDKNCNFLISNEEGFYYFIKYDD